MQGFLDFWQHLPSHMKPEIFQLGSFRLQWYGLMYIFAFVLTYLLAKYRVAREERFPFDENFLKDILTYAFVGVLAGGRLGYVLFYNLKYYSQHPLEIILPFDFSNGMQFTGISGMSYHGGLIGVIFSVLLFARNRKVNWRTLADLFAPVIPLGYTFGRLGNFINGELYGRVTQSPIGMYFTSAPTMELRHPSQLYEATFEGLVLFLVLWSIRKVKLPKGSMLGAYLIGYGTVRFFIEFFRQPDSHLGFVLGYLSMGQVLCLAMIVAGLLALAYVAMFKSEGAT